mgnify:CR=1 FL=1|jgi:hypothetical protein
MREKGDVLENLVKEIWPTEGKEWINKEANSGAKYGENDLVSSKYSIECKRKTCSKSLSLTKQEINQCINRSVKRNKSPLWVSETDGDRVFVTMQLVDFINLIKTNAILMEDAEREIIHEEEESR